MKIVNWLKPLIDHLWENSIEDFDYPGYAGLPKKICNQLSSEIVDLIQENIDGWSTSKTKKEFTKRILEDLSRGLIV